MEEHLAKNELFAGPRYSLAGISLYPCIAQLKARHEVRGAVPC
jgi:hypothetical protein